MAVENITLNIIPTGDTPSIHVAQFDVDRPFTVTLKEGTDDFIPTEYNIELQVRKVDATIVTVLPVQTSGNVVTFNTTEQMTACSGTNLAELQLTKDSQTFATLHFYLVVQRDVLAGGVTSESDIYNLTEQIAEIVPEVIGDDYYNKEEVDEKIAEIPTFDPTNYYDKSDVDTLLNGKADVSDLPDMTNYYDKSETDALLDDKADVSDLPDMNNYYDKSETDVLLDDKADVSDIPDMSDYYTKSEVDTKITDLYQIKTASGSIVHITDGGNAIPVKSLVSQITAVESGSGEKSPANPYTISGFANGIITVTDNDQITNTYTFAFGQTVYGGHFDNKGNLVVTHKIVDFGDLGYYYSNGRFSSTDIPDVKNVSVWNSALTLCSCYEITEVQTWTQGDFIIGLYGKSIYVKDSRYTDTVSFKQGLTGQKFVVELATPITLAITSQDIPTLLGENNIFSNCGDVEVKYFTEKSDGIAELIKAFM